MKAPLCKCLNCGEILIDTNPQVHAKEHDATSVNKELQFIEDKDGGTHACPNCKTDEHLIDL